MVTVIIPAYNCEKYLTATVESVKSQTYQDWNMFIIDDCSTDGTGDLAERLAEDDKRISVLHNKVNSGVSKTRNRGIREADSEWIALLDSDDLWEADKLERQLTLAKKEVDIIYCSYDMIDERGTPVHKPFIVPAETDFNAMLTSSAISCSTALIRANVLKEHLFHSDVYHEDYLLWMELLQIPCKAAGEKKILVHYRQTQGARNIRKGKAAKERWVIYRKHLHLGLAKSIYAFAGYTLKGIIKYYL